MLNKMVKKMTRSEQNEGVEDEKNKGISIKKKWIKDDRDGVTRQENFKKKRKIGLRIEKVSFLSFFSQSLLCIH